MKFLPLLFALLAAPALLAQQPPTAPEPGAIPTLSTPKIDTPPISLNSDVTSPEPEPPKPVVPVEEPLLPVPAGPILDQAGVLRADAVERLTAALTAARAKDVWVYMLTVPSLRVLPSKQQDKLEALAKRYAAAWTKKTVGAVIVFDDEGGLMSVTSSPEAKRRFEEFVIDMRISEALEKIHSTGLAREKLEKTTQITAEVLCQLQAQYAEASRRQQKTNLFMGVVALLGVGLAVWSAVQGSKNPTPEKPEPKLETKPPSVV